MSESASRPPFIVFGYGSLIFKPPPHTIKQTPGFLKGYVRRFAQKSHDHRGTPEKPGRVVTLVHKEDWDAFSGSVRRSLPEEDTVWGLAYTIDFAYESEVRDYLGTFLATDGYTMEQLDIYGIDPHDGSETVIIHNHIDVLTSMQCYVGRNDNPSFIGSEPLPALARTIWESVGPSGPNKDYLYDLVKAVKDISPDAHDSYLSALEVRESRSRREVQDAHQRQAAVRQEDEPSASNDLVLVQ
ncbi:ChaC-like protein [Hymenopellis radicata]|nr:ChaC-like protein [Hymenopellis radicata]